MNKDHVLFALAQRYPQLVLPIKEGTCKTDLYKSLVLRGEPIAGLQPDFSLNPGDTFQAIDTPSGPAEVLSLIERKDFEHAVRALAYKCEPKSIPESMGAISIGGLIDWGKINAHKMAWLADGNDPSGWAIEFGTFTKDRENIRNSIIILSSGPYSAVSAAQAEVDEREWIEKSIAIRKYHELTHIVSRRLYPDNEDAIRDEVLADYVGLVAAFGMYDSRLAKLFLGIEGEGVREGGRLANYVKEGESLEEAERFARFLVDEFAAFDKDFEAAPDKERHFEALKAIETGKIGL